VVIHDLDFVCVTVSPDKTDAPLIIDANAVLTLAFAFQGLESIGRWDAEIIQTMGIVEHT